MRYLSFLALALLFTACKVKFAEVDGLAINAVLDGAAGQVIALDEPNGSSGQFRQISSMTAEKDRFQLAVPGGVEPGLYRLRVGAERMNLLLQGSEAVVLTGRADEVSDYGLTIVGSDGSAELGRVMQQLNAAEELRLSLLTEVINGINDPRVAAFVATKYLKRVDPTYSVPLYQQVRDAMTSDMALYNELIADLSKGESELRRRQASNGGIRVGMEAPDIELYSPDSTLYKLSDLRGQVVLLDFWASWCGPCRRENPNVVDVYNRYKDQGFTVYSVSLDGLDPRRSGNLNAEQRARQTDSHRQRWVSAIEADGLTWPSHVSELQKWSSTAAQTYGVRGIPKTFLIDRDGNIAAVNLRGAEAIEQALQRVL
ncbi:MAG: TlpA disulfide reductase family protein [Bacteroidota bacterium]